MAEVNLNINGRSYPILCDDGQEERIEKLADYIDERVRGIAASGAATSDNHVLVLAALIIADEVFELRDSVSVTQEIVGAQTTDQAIPGFSSAEEEAVAQTLKSLSTRISMVSDRLKKI